MSEHTLTTVIGAYPHTEPLKDGRVQSDLLTLDHINYQPVHDAFPIMVNDLKFDVCEMAIATFLQARDAGIALSLLPVALVGRFQHSFLVRGTGTEIRRPEDLAGRRVGVRAYTVTTGMWVRGILQHQYGVHTNGITWRTYDPSHVASYQNPPNVESAPRGSSLLDDVTHGRTDAAIIGGASSSRDVVPVIQNPDAASRAWYDEHQLVPVNHLVAVRSELLRAEPQIGPELVRMFARAKSVGGVPPSGLAGELGVDPTPIGAEALLPAVAMAAELCFEQELLRAPIDASALFEVTG